MNVERDHGPEAIRGYLPTGRALDVVRRVAAGFIDPRAGRAFSITGPHGGGKSSLAVFFDALLDTRGSEASELAMDLISSVDPAVASLAEQALSELDPLGTGFARAFCTASREPVRHTVARSLHAAATQSLGARQKVVPKSFQDPTPDIDSRDILAAVERFAGQVPIVMIIDEFGKNLEAYMDSGDDGDLYLLQQLAEAGQGSTALPFTILTLQHLSFDEYVQDASAQRRREWAKVQGRFQDIPYVETGPQSRRLIAATMTVKDSRLASGVKSWMRDREQQLADLGLRDLFLETLDAYPLHPTTLAALPDLCSRYGQNERTLFSFLGGPEPLAVPAFLKDHEWGRGTDLAFVGLDRVYDYFLDSASTSLGASASASRWLEIENRIRDAVGISRDQRAALKTIGVLNLISTSGILRASAPVVVSAMEASTPDLSEGERQALLGQLQEMGLITYREFSDEYRIWQGSDYDLRGNVEIARASLQGRALSDLLNSVIELDPVVAGRSSQKHGVLRVFRREFTDLVAEPAAPGDGDAWDGLLLLSTTQDVAQLSKLPRGSRPVVVALPRSIEGLHEAAAEALALQTTLESAQAAAADWVATRELAERLAVAEQNLRDLVAHRWAPGQVEWRLLNTMREITSAGTVSGVLSEACERVYSATPRVANEMVARRELTSQGAKARRLLIEAMLTNRSLEAFGLDGYGPERAMYEAIFRSTGLQREVEGQWVITDPEDAKWSSVWRSLNESLDSCSDARKGLPEIADVLRRPPYGLKDGVVTLLLLTALAARERDIALYEHGSLVMRLDDAVAERLARNPNHFTVKNLATEEGPRRAAMDSLARTLVVAPNGRRPTFLQVARAIYKELRELPPYTQTTRRGLSDSAIAVRDLFKTSVEPDVLFFSDLPQALGLEPFPAEGEADPAKAEDFASRLADVLLTLKQRFPGLLLEITHGLADATTSTTRELRELQRRLAGQAINLQDHVLDPRLRAFLGALAREQSDPETWLQNVAMVATDGHSPRSWTDEIEDRFVIHVADLGGALRRTQALLYERVAAGAETFDSRRLTITRPDGSEESHIVAITESEREVVGAAIKGPIETLIDAMGSEEAARKALLGWLVLGPDAKPGAEISSDHKGRGASA